MRGGEIIISDCGSDAVTRMPTVQCVHCGCHWVPTPGSGTVRGFCCRCNGPICGVGCAECVPQEQLIENIEQGKPLGYRPIRVAPGFGK